MTAAATLRRALPLKEWTTMQARAALRGWQLWRSSAADGPVRYFVARWGMVRALADLDEVEQWLERAGAA